MDQLRQITGVGSTQSGSSTGGLADQLSGGVDVGAFNFKQGLHGQHTVEKGIERALLGVYSSDATSRSRDIMSK